MALIGKQKPVFHSEEPRSHSVPGTADDFRGREAVEFCRWAGMTLFPWQEDLLRDSLTDVSVTDPDDSSIQETKPAFPHVVSVISRQNGKGEYLIARELYEVYFSKQPVAVLHTAHYGKTVLKAQDRTWDIISNSPHLMKWGPWVKEFGESKAAPKKVTSNGKECIKFPNGSEIAFATRSGTQGAGTSSDLLILDECFDLPDGTADALTYTTRARPKAQTIWISSPVNRRNPKHLHGQQFSRRRWAGIDGVPGYLFREWSLPEGADPFTRDSWELTNPSLISSGLVGKSLSDVESEAQSAQVSEEAKFSFLAEDLGTGDWWPRDSGSVDDFVPVIDFEAWSSASALMPSALGESCLAVDVTPDGESVGMVSAAQWGDKVYLSLAPYEEFDRALVIEKVGTTVGLNDPSAVVLDPSGQCSTLVEPLRGIGVAPETLSGAQVSKAYELFLRMWAEKRIAHDGSQRWLDALGVAQERSKNGRYRSLDRYSGDVTVLVAASLAVWGLQEFGVGDVEVDVKRTRHYVSSARAVKKQRRVSEMSF